MDCLLGGGSEGLLQRPGSAGSGVCVPQTKWQLLCHPPPTPHIPPKTNKPPTTWSTAAVTNKEFRWRTEMQRNMTGLLRGKINLQQICGRCIQWSAGLCRGPEDTKVQVLAGAQKFGFDCENSDGWTNSFDIPHCRDIYWERCGGPYVSWQVLWICAEHQLLQDTWREAFKCCVVQEMSSKHPDTLWQTRGGTVDNSW